MSKRARDDSSELEDGLSSSSYVSIDSFPQELLSLIFSHLDVDHRARASRVCRGWRAAALQPPYSADWRLLLNVILRESDRWTDSELLEQGSRQAFRRVQLPEEAAALLGGPLCRGLRELSLCIMLPTESGADSIRQSAAMPGGSSLAKIGAALPPTLVKLSIFIGPAIVWIVLRQLDLARNVPRLEDLDLCGDMKLDPELGISHPSLRWLDTCYRGKPSFASVLDRFPSVKFFSRISIDRRFGAENLAGLLDAGIHVKRLYVSGVPLSEGHMRLLMPGSALALYDCSLPPGEDWTLPANLQEVELSYHSLTPAQLEFLLHRTSSYASGLRKLVFSPTTLDRSLDERTCRPRDVVDALLRMPATGGTQIKISWLNSSFTLDQDAAACLARALATSPTLQRYVDLEIDCYRVTDAGFAADFAAYRSARVAALREMGGR